MLQMRNLPSNPNTLQTTLNTILWIHNVAHQNSSTMLHIKIDPQLNIISSRMCQQDFWRDHENLRPYTHTECELTTQHARRYNYMQNYLQRVHSWWDHSLLWTNLYKLPGIVWPSHSPSQSCPANPLWSVTKARSRFLTLPRGRVPRKLDMQFQHCVSKMFWEISKEYLKLKLCACKLKNNESKVDAMFWQWFHIVWHIQICHR